MPEPSLLTDGVLFLPNVLTSQSFQQRGLLLKTEGRVSWAVVDPRRYVMTVWEKDRTDFVEAAIARNSAVITNAPFLLYAGGAKWWTVTKYAVETFFRQLVVGFAGSAREQLDRLERIDRRMKEKYFSADIVEGIIYGRQNLISDARNPRPRASYFGRKQGRLFADYVVARGDPPAGTPEVIGGLFQSVENYAPVDAGTAAQLGTWGLAPFTGVPDPQRLQWREAGLDAALSEYEQAARGTGPDHVPFGETVPPAEPCAGLIVALFGGGAPSAFASLLAGVLVQSAVRVDGNDSILLGSGANMLQGQFMGEYKRVYNRYGYECRPG